MEPEGRNESFSLNPQPGSVPPTLPTTEPPVIGAPPPSVASFPPVLPPNPPPRARPGRQLLAIILSVCLGLFLADAIISLIDDSLSLFFGVHYLTGIRGLVFFFAML